MSMPEFTAELSLFRSERHYRTFGGMGKSSGLALPPAPVFPQSCNCPQGYYCCGTDSRCCADGTSCLLWSDGTSAGCCDGNPCIDSNGFPYCASGDAECCGESGCAPPSHCCLGQDCLPQGVECTTSGNGPTPGYACQLASRHCHSECADLHLPAYVGTCECYASGTESSPGFTCDVNCDCIEPLAKCKCRCNNGWYYNASSLAKCLEYCSPHGGQCLS
jgi:hypothetical protein